jgi:hypothetical protein
MGVPAISGRSHRIVSPFLAKHSEEAKRREINKPARAHKIIFQK